MRERSLYVPDELPEDGVVKDDRKKLTAWVIPLYGQRIGVVQRRAGDKQVCAFQ